MRTTATNPMHPMLSVTLLALAIAGSPAQANGHASHGHGSVQQAPGAMASRWPADATLKKEMLGIRQAVEALGHHEHRHLDAAQIVALATKVDAHVQAIVAGCHLPPDADAALHGVIASLTRGTGALKADPSQAQAIAGMRDAVAQYDRLFDEGASARE